MKTKTTTPKTSTAKSAAPKASKGTTTKVAKAPKVKAPVVKVPKAEKAPVVKVPKAEKASVVKVPKAEKAPKVTGPIIAILSALYGIDDARISFNPKVGRKLSNKMVGSDPAPKEVKNAIITATIDGVSIEKIFTEGEVISF